MIEIIKNKKDDYKFTLKAESGNILLNSVLFQNENEAKQIVQNLFVIQQKR